jgi:hypothetical protein
MAKSKLSDDWMLFIQHSEALTGIVPFDLSRPSTQRHIEMCTIVVSGPHFLDPRLVNGLITGNPQKFESLLRTGTEGALRRVLPSASEIKRALHDWIQDVENSIGALQYEMETHKVDFAWEMHDRLICIHPFKTGNGRTARVMFNHIRRLLGLPVHVIRDEDADKYYARLEHYRENVFLPSLALP